MNPRRIYTVLAVLMLLWAACPAGPLGLGFTAGTAGGRMSAALGAVLFFLALSATVFVGRRAAMRVAAGFAACIWGVCPMLFALFGTAEYAPFYIALYAVASGLALGWYVAAALGSPDDAASLVLPPWGRTSAFLALTGVALCALGCVLAVAGWCAASIAVSVTLAAALVARMGLGDPIEGAFGYNIPVVVSFSTFGAGCSLYAGIALFAALEATPTSLGVARWMAFALGACATVMASVPLRRMLVRGRYGLAYGNVSRISTVVLPVVGVVYLMLLTHTRAAGFVLLAVPPAASMLLMVSAVSEMVGQSRDELSRALKGLLGYSSLGAALGMVLALLLSLIGDVNLRYQCVLLFLVVTCLYPLPSLPRRAGTAADLLKDELPENLSAAERQAQAAAELAGRTGLTQREREVFCLLVTNIPLAQIGAELGISAKTVQNHVSNIYAKLGVHSLRDALRLLEG